MFSWVQFITYVLVTALTPGPNNIMSMTNAGRVGLKKSIPFNLGIFTGFSTVSLLCLIFCKTLSTVIPVIKMPMIIIGAAYMLWLAWKTFRSSSVIEEDQRGGSYISGLLLQFVNPKSFIYAIVSLEVYVIPYYSNNWGMLLFFAILLAVIAFCSNILWASCGSLFKTLFSKYAKITNTVMALLLVYCAISLFL